MPNVNPTILMWARETAGLSLDEASQKLGIRAARDLSPSQRLEALESGEDEPSRPMLVKMAKKYRRPLIIFYMEHPPQQADRGSDFRTLPDTYTAFDRGLVDALIRDVQVRQSILRAALEDDEDVEPLSFVGSIEMSARVDTVIEKIIAETNFDRDKYREQPTPRDAFKYLRNQVENSGVYVLLIGDLGSYHTAFDLDVFRGFAISDILAPFIIINDRDSHAAWSFTLIHELTHIWLGQTGISAGRSNLQVEKFCNRVAGEFLLPEFELKAIDFDEVDDFEGQRDLISTFAHSHNLSSSMVAYKLFLMEKINHATWISLSEEYKNLWLNAREERREQQRGRSGGPGYYIVRRHRLGENLISQVHQMIIGGSLTTTKASKILGVAPKNVQNLVEPNIQVGSS